MTGSFKVSRIWTDDFVECYAMALWVEKNTELGIYFLLPNGGVNIGDTLKGELTINCASITEPEQLSDLDNGIKMETYFNTIHDTVVTAKAVLKKFTDEIGEVYCYINDDFDNIKIKFTKSSDSSCKCGDSLYIRGLLELEIDE